MNPSVTNKQKGPEPKRPDTFLLSRRAFIGISAAVAAVFTVLLAIKRPELNKPAKTQSTRAIATQDLVATSCLNCPTRCAIRVRKVHTFTGETRVVKIFGNPSSTYSEGKCCPRSHIGLQVLYNPDRFQKPLKRKGGTTKGRGVDFKNDFEEVRWEDAIAEIAKKIEATPPNRVLILEGLNSSSNEDLIRQFALAYGTPNLFTEEEVETGANREGKRIADGRIDSGYELVSEGGIATRYILSFSAGIVESEKPLARNLRLWGKLRREMPNRTKVVAIEPRYSVTASRADEWIPINPGAEGALAMAIAHVIVTEGLYDSEFISNHTQGFESFRQIASTDRFSPDRVSEIAGVPADTIIRIAREFAQTRPAVAWSGEGATSWTYGTSASHAIYCLNALVGSIDVPGGIVYQQYPPYADMPTDGLPITKTGISFRKMADLLSAGDIDIAIGFNSNLIMTIPESREGGRWDEILKNLFYVHIGSAKNEMAAYADFILPACTYLEDWGYESAIPGSGFAETRIKQPVIEPQYDSRTTARILFDLATSLKISNLFSPITSGPENFAEDFVKYRTSTLPDHTNSTMPPWPLLPWDKFKSTGVWRGPSYQYGQYHFGTPSGKFEFHSDHLIRLLDVSLPGDNNMYPLELIIYRPVLEIKNGSQNFPWAQEMFLVMHGRGWNNLVEMNRETANDLGIRDGNRVIVESANGRIEGEARVFEGIRPGVVAIASGQGRFATGRYADGMGINPTTLMGTDYDEESGQPTLFGTRIRVRRA